MDWNSAQRAVGLGFGLGEDYVFDAEKAGGMLVGADHHGLFVMLVVDLGAKGTLEIDFVVDETRWVAETVNH